MARAALFYHVGTWSNTPGLIMKIEQLPPYFECVLSRLGYAKRTALSTFKIKMILLNDFVAYV